MKTLSKALNKAVNAENLEDIIFENRNHEYGAYALRKNYNNRISLSLLVVLSVASLITIIAVTRSMNQPPETTAHIPFMDTMVVVVDDIEEYVLQVPEEILASSASLERSLFHPVISDEDIIFTDVILTEELPTFSVGDINPNLQPVTLVYTSGDPSDNAIENPNTTFNELQVSEQAMFRGGTVEDFRKWLIETIEYPSQAERLDLFGTVFVKFTVGKDGKIRDVIVQRSIHPYLDKAAVDAILASPDDWRAARINGNPVNVSYTIPIKYNLQM